MSLGSCNVEAKAFTDVALVGSAVAADPAIVLNTSTNCQPALKNPFAKRTLFTKRATTLDNQIGSGSSVSGSVSRYGDGTFLSTSVFEGRVHVGSWKRF